MELFQEKIRKWSIRNHGTWLGNRYQMEETTKFATWILVIKEVTNYWRLKSKATRYPFLSQLLCTLLNINFRSSICCFSLTSYILKYTCAPSSSQVLFSYFTKFKKMHSLYCSGAFCMYHYNQNIILYTIPINLHFLFPVQQLLTMKIAAP